MDTVTVGTTLSVTGRYRLQGCQALAALHAWANAVNAAGGLNVPGSNRSFSLTLLHHDDASSADRAARNTEKLIGNPRVRILVGPYGSNLARAAARVAAAHRRVLWNQGGASDDVHQPGGRAVGILTPVSRYFDGVLEMIHARDPEARRAVFLYRDASFGRLAVAGTEVTGRGLGITVTGLPYADPMGDLPALLNRIREQQPDLILHAGIFYDDCALASELVNRGVKVKAMGFVGAAMRDFGLRLGERAEGFVAPSQWEASQRGLGPASPVDVGPDPWDVAHRIQAGGVSPDYPAAQAYAAGLIAQRCVAEAPDLDDEALWQEACALDCTTFFGRFRIDPETGLQVGHRMVCVQWQGGHKVVVWPPEVAEASFVHLRT